MYSCCWLIGLQLTQKGKKAFHNSVLRETILEACQQHDIDELILIRAVLTCWNTIADMLERSLHLHDILMDICDQMRFNKTTGLRLCQYMMTEEEWEVLDQCSDYLEVHMSCLYFYSIPILAHCQLFKHAILDFSKSGKPLIFEVFPAIDKLMWFLEQGRDDMELHAAVRMACYRAMLVLNKYYAKSDESVIYRIAVSKSILIKRLYIKTLAVMHPGYKLQYFRSQNWLQDWIDEAIVVLCEEWNDYKPQSATPSSTSVHAPTRKVWNQQYNAYSHWWLH